MTAFRVIVSLLAAVGLFGCEIGERDVVALARRLAQSSRGSSATHVECADVGISLVAVVSDGALFVLDRARVFDRWSSLGRYFPSDTAASWADFRQSILLADERELDYAYGRRPLSSDELAAIEKGPSVWQWMEIPPQEQLDRIRELNRLSAVEEVALKRQMESGIRAWLVKEGIPIANIEFAWSSVDKLSEYADVVAAVRVGRRRGAIGFRQFLNLFSASALGRLDCLTSPSELIVLRR
jgi:hypothetical protein